MLSAKIFIWLHFADGGYELNKTLPLKVIKLRCNVTRRRDVTNAVSMRYQKDERCKKMATFKSLLNTPF